MFFTTKLRTLSTTSSKQRAWLWFIGLYVASIVVLGSFHWLVSAILLPALRSTL